MFQQRLYVLHQAQDEQVAMPGPYEPKESDGDVEKAYKDIMGGLDKAYTNTVNKDVKKKDPKGGRTS